MSAASRAARIAVLNDQFRTNLGMPGPGVPPGQVMITSGIAALPPVAQVYISRRVRLFNAFSSGNDPYAEHDFGAIDLPDGQRVFWKIDYYADAACEAGSEDPADPARSYRVMTIMLAEEYCFVRLRHWPKGRPLIKRWLIIITRNILQYL